MNTINKLLLIIFFFFCQNLNGTQNNSAKIAVLSSPYLYNENYASLAILVPSLMKYDNKIISVKIIKPDKNVYFEHSINNDNEYKVYKTNIMHDKLLIGFLELKYSKIKKELDFTIEEKEWIEKNKIIKLATMSYWNHNDRGDTFSGDLLKLINEYGDLNIIEVSFNSWNKAYNDVITGNNLHGIMNLSWSKEREDDYFHYTIPYNYTPYYLVVKKENKDIVNLANLEGKSVYIKENSITKNIITKEQKDIKIIEVKTETDLYSHLRQKKDASASIVSSKDVNNLREFDIKIVQTINSMYAEVSIGVGKNNIQLKTILNKILLNLPHEEIEKLRKKEYNTKNSLKFNSQEIKWIKNNYIEILRKRELPILLSDNTYNLDGIAGDILNLMIINSGLKLNIINNTKSDELEKLKSNKINIIPNAYYEKKNEKWAKYIGPYYITKNYLYFKENNNIKQLSDLNHKTLVMLKNIKKEKKIKRLVPEVNIIFAKTVEEAMAILMEGKADAILEKKIKIDFLIRKNLTRGLNHIYVNELKPAPLYFMIKKENTILASILNKSLNDIGEKMQFKIASKWLNDDNILKFTIDEKMFLDKKELVKYRYNNNQEPLVWSSNINVFIGILPDILKLLEEKSGLNLQENKTGNHKDTIIAGIMQVNISQNKYIFTKENIFESPFVFVSQLKRDYFEGINALNGKRIGIIKDSNIHKILKNRNVNLNYIFIEDYRQAFLDLQKEKIDVIVTNATLAQYYLNIFNDDNLKIAYKTNMMLNLKIAMPKDTKSVVSSILNKTIAAISQKEIQDIIYKYTNKNITREVDWELLLKIGGVLLTVFIFIIYNNKKLNKMVIKKTKDIIEQKEELRILSNSLEIKVEVQTINLATQLKEIKKIHKSIKESIDYAALIQNLIVSNDKILFSFFEDSFLFWSPKDIVGGDIFLIQSLREDECLIMYIDCTGHGVGGAFVTMLIKAIESQIVSEIQNNINLEVSPARILSYFNQQLKTLLKQDNISSQSNVGFDGGIIYYNKKEHIIKYAGANTTLFYIDEKEELQSERNNRYSAGYLKCDIDYKYQESIIKVNKGMKFYCTTDGFIDQNGGELGFPFGSAKFKNLILDNHNKKMEDQRTVFIDSISKYQKEYENLEQTDDITLFVFKT